MRTIELEDAMGQLRSLVEAVERGETATIMRDGRAVAELRPIERPPHPKGFVEHLLSYPGGLDLERDRRPMRDLDL